MPAVAPIRPPAPLPPATRPPTQPSQPFNNPLGNLLANPSATAMLTQLGLGFLAFQSSNSVVQEITGNPVALAVLGGLALAVLRR